MVMDKLTYGLASLCIAAVFAFFTGGIKKICKGYLKRRKNNDDK